MELVRCQPTWVSRPQSAVSDLGTFGRHPATEKAHKFVDEGMLRGLERRKLRARITNKKHKPTARNEKPAEKGRKIQDFPTKQDAVTRRCLY